MGLLRPMLNLAKANLQKLQNKWRSIWARTNLCQIWFRRGAALMIMTRTRDLQLSSFRLALQLKWAVRLGIAALCLTVFGLSLFNRAQAQTAPEAGLEPLVIVTSTGSHAFSVEVMRTDEERAKGLMFRRFMPKDRGMLFDFKREDNVAMWMKNTYLPLDMVFISKAGVVVNIAQNTEPLSERIIPSGAPTYAVLEVNAGTAKAIGLKVGDRIQHSLFAK